MRRDSMRAKLGNRKLIAVFLLMLYVVSFVPLAWFGGYLPRASRHFRIAPGLAFEDSWVWQPRYGMFYRFQPAGGGEEYRADALGWIYSPLILLQQQCLHPTIRIVQSDGSRVASGPRKPLRTQLHPEVLRILPKIESDFHSTYEEL